MAAKKATTKKATAKRAKTRRQRRTRGEGSTWHDGPTWFAQATVNGKRVRVQGPSLDNVRAKLRALQVARASSATAVDGITVAEYLGQWLKIAQPTLKLSSYQRAEEIVRLHIVPRIGALGLVKLAATNIETMYAELLATGMAPRTVGHVHRTLSRALKIAVRQHVLDHNVAVNVDPPRVGRLDREWLSGDEVKRMEAAAFGTWATQGTEPVADRLAPLFVLAVRTGARLGEVLGLRWADVDLKGKSIVVRRSLEEVSGSLALVETKTGRARRVDLDEASVRALRGYKARVAEDAMTARNRAAKHAADGKLDEAAQASATADALAAGDLVFVDTEGKPLRRSNVRRRHWLPILKRAGLPLTTRIHDLRHAHASIALQHGASIVDVASRLGHADTSTTLRRYAHALPGGGRAVADKVSSALGD